MSVTKEEFASIIQQADKFVIANDRARYLPALRAIERFAVDRKMIISGRTGVRALLGTAREPLRDADTWVLDLYGVGIAKIARECLRATYDALAGDAIDARTLVLHTVVEDREYHIMLEYRIVAVLHDLGERKGISIIDLIEPVIAEGPFGARDALLMPRDIQIMRIAHLLSFPGVDAAIAKQWPDLLEQLCALFALPEAGVTHAGAGAGTIDKHEEEHVFDRGIVTHWDDVAHEGIVIGEAAVAALVPAFRGRVGRAQYVCSFEGVDEYARESGIDISYTDVRVPDDFRLRKISLRGKIPTDIFNAAEYEPIPFTIVDGARIAGPFCVLRFLYVDIWTLEFIIKMSAHGARDGLIMRKRILYMAARALWDWILGVEDIAQLFPTSYAGLYVSEASAKMRAGGGNFFAAPKKDLIDLAREIAERINSS
jgi:hypothetical protein